MPKSRTLLLILAVALSSTTLFAQQQKPQSNDEKHTFRLETDSGRYGVASEKFDPKLLGVAIYPGAKGDQTENEGKGANLSLEWGRQGAHLYVQKYVTPDAPDQVLAFYRKQLAKYGPVVECRNGKAVAPVASELRCDDDENSKDAEHEKHSSDVELKAGTERKQHVVGVTPKEHGTQFHVLYIETTKRGEI